VHAAPAGAGWSSPGAAIAASEVMRGVRIVETSRYETVRHLHTRRTQIQEGDRTGYDGERCILHGLYTPRGGCLSTVSGCVTTTQSPRQNSLTRSRFVPSNPLASMRDIAFDNPPACSRPSRQAKTRRRPERVKGRHRSASTREAGSSRREGRKMSRLL